MMEAKYKYSVNDVESFAPSAAINECDNPEVECSIVEFQYAASSKAAAEDFRDALNDDVGYCAYIFQCKTCADWHLTVLMAVKLESEKVPSTALAYLEGRGAAYDAVLKGYKVLNDDDDASAAQGEA